MEDLKQLIREIPDYPKPGILFYDITTLLKDQKGFKMMIDRLCGHYTGHTIDLVAGIEARGFIFAPALAYRLNAGFVPVRKPNKLAVEDGEDFLCAGIWNGHDGDARRRGEKRATGAVVRRFAGDGGNGGGGGAVDSIAGWSGGRRGVRGGAEFLAGAGKIAGD